MYIYIYTCIWIRMYEKGPQWGVRVPCSLFMATSPYLYDGFKPFQEICQHEKSGKNCPRRLSMSPISMTYTLAFILMPVASLSAITAAHGQPI